MVASPPAFTVAVGFMVRTIASFTPTHGPTDVMVSVTFPAAISAAEGVYVAFTRAALSNVPVPEVDQIDEVALPPNEPDKVCVLPEQQ